MSPYLASEVARCGVDAFAGERRISVADFDVAAIAQLVVGSVERESLHHVGARAKELSVQLKHGFGMLHASFRRPRACLYVSEREEEDRVG